MIHQKKKGGELATKNNKIEILINPFVEYISKNDTFFLDKEQIEKINRGLNIDKSKVKTNYNFQNEKIQIIDKEIYYRLLSDNQIIEFYFKCIYDFKAILNFEYLNGEKGTNKISFNFIRYGFIKYRINESHEISALQYEYEYESPISIEEFDYPVGLKNDFKSAHLRKRKLVCHYTKREVAIEKIIASKTLRFNEIKNTNDPWDYKKNITPSLKKDNDLIKAIVNSSETQFKSEKVKSISFTRDSTKPRCFENVLMWAHYAENHKGVCLVFDEQKLKWLFEQQFLEKCLKPKIVSYTEFTSEIEIDDNDVAMKILKKNAKQLFYTKNKAWKYELEYRLMLLPDNKNDTFLNEIDKALVAIIIGLEFSNTYKCVIEDLKRKYYPNIKFYQMKWDSKGYFRIRDLNSTEELKDCSEILNDYLIEI